MEFQLFYVRSHNQLVRKSLVVITISYTTASVFWHCKCFKCVAISMAARSPQWICTLCKMASITLDWSITLSITDNYHLHNDEASFPYFLRRETALY